MIHAAVVGIETGVISVGLLKDLSDGLVGCVAGSVSLTAVHVLML